MLYSNTSILFYWLSKEYIIILIGGDIMGPKPKYETYEQIRQARNEAQHRYYEKNKEAIKEKARQRYQANKDKAKDSE